VFLIVEIDVAGVFFPDSIVLHSDFSFGALVCAFTS